MESLARVLRHAVHHKRAASKAFSKQDLTAISRAIHDMRQRHEAEIMVVIENSLSGKRLARGTTARQRAVEIFAKYKTWDTEANNGILIYVLLADRSVSILHDRGLKQIADSAWTDAVSAIRGEFREGRFKEGLFAGISTVSRHLPARTTGNSELPEAPIVI